MLDIDVIHAFTKFYTRDGLHFDEVTAAITNSNNYLILGRLMLEQHLVDKKINVITCTLKMQCACVKCDEII